MNSLNPFKKKKNRRFNYTPRYYSGKSIGNIYDFDSKFYKYRETFNANDYRESWDNERLKMRTRKNNRISIRLILIILLLTFISLYILGFDISIFYNKS
ncbi:MAG: hypothetical protein CMC88_05110 [Flavobacteriaceae bacterium]|nr:hypothetical protein [Flavobacteriaceae bacterium]|tara:strand:- start:14384 stop:14680 length:297 start_codon:yes stop_codon:yes gene_type:complete